MGCSCHPQPSRRGKRTTRRQVFEPLIEAVRPPPQVEAVTSAPGWINEGNSVMSVARYETHPHWRWCVGIETSTGGQDEGSSERRSIAGGQCRGRGQAHVAVGPAELAVVFDDVAESYHDAEVLGFFAPVAGHLLDRLALRGHEALLDIGCGSGAVLTAAGWRLGPRSEMTGIDASARMIERARGALRGRRRAGATARDGRSTPELSPGAFDLITASMVLFFLPDPSRALRSWSRLLRPRGRVGITSFGEQTDAWRHPSTRLSFVPRTSLMPRVPPCGVFASDEALADCFQGARFP